MTSSSTVADNTHISLANWFTATITPDLSLQHLLMKYPQLATGLPTASTFSTADLRRTKNSNSASQIYHEDRQRWDPLWTFGSLSFVMQAKVSLLLRLPRAYSCLGMNERTKPSAEDGLRMDRLWSDQRRRSDTDHSHSQGRRRIRCRTMTARSMKTAWSQMPKGLKNRSAACRWKRWRTVTTKDNDTIWTMKKKRSIHTDCCLQNQRTTRNEEPVTASKTARSAKEQWMKNEFGRMLMNARSSISNRQNHTHTAGVSWSESWDAVQRTNNPLQIYRSEETWMSAGPRQPQFRLWSQEGNNP